MAKDFSQAFYHSRIWKDCRKQILIRDAYTCRWCGDVATEVHHIKRLTEYNINDPHISLNPENLISLCRTCHCAEHNDDRQNDIRKSRGLKPIDENPYTFDADGQLVRRS